MQTVIKKWGNSLGCRIPSLWAKDNGVKNGSIVEIISETGKITILPVKKTLDSLLEQITDKNIHPEVSTSSPIGKEEW